MGMPCTSFIKLCIIIEGKHYHANMASIDYEPKLLAILSMVPQCQDLATLQGSAKQGTILTITRDLIPSPREKLTRFDSINSSKDFGHSHAFSSFDDGDPFDSSGPFKVSSEDQTPKKSSGNWSSF